MRTDAPDRSEPSKTALDRNDSDPGGRAPDDDPATTGAGSARVSRRTFVLATGFVGTGLAGSGPGAAGSSRRTVTLAATEPYRPSTIDVARAFERASDGTDVRVRPVRYDPSGGLREGDADVLVSGRPTLPTVDASPGEVVRTVTAAGWAGLTHAASEWRDCLSGRELRDRWRGDGVVETWSETDWRSVAALERTVGSATSDGSAGGDRSSDRSDGGWEALVRGRRPYQYARGFGGVGYYAVEGDAIDDAPGVRAASDRVAVPIVRLGYAHAQRAAVDPAVEEFLGFFRRRNRPAEIAFHAGPTAQNGDARGRTPELARA